ncbi:lysophospholipid acyltransferase family protein (plasmid) [Cereibacter azotoformans]|uniref:Phospholipid/glycerol acyltransferase n=1 Tax=Cereibacter sphaeroides (strain ATCC 17025 / ATH 2.4.3) TaxID=349102 RepID=A4WX52_CERS5|nr:lysophospholipid acyltransferase family protein [Cereibacter azotoformans]AXQ94509.1 glycerol acyltransferase [Cereibacter sphaeroides]MBO4170654.1 lysophospholipid acyltransferase family protein [Cereibacter azotoformans]UIJ30060.1 lysophospholipid acyltransferase family protein [Cereibacter azotoformans]ULB12735.1 lysophospholipid acyltransferase family protein [Cereibacter azotoformans]
MSCESRRPLVSLMMQSRIDPLIEERAPWLFSGRPHHDLCRRLLTRVLSYDRTVQIGETLKDDPAPEIMRRVAAMIARDVEVSGLENLPRNGPALVVCNHPTGIADGIILHRALAPLRPDLFFYANRDILRVLPQMEEMICPVEWRPEKRSHQKTRETMDYTRRAIETGRLGVIFPSGRLAKRTGLKLMERPWMASAAMIARKFDLPVVPVNIRARNSTLFYLFDLIHPTLRDITLFHEVLNKHRQPFRITMGRPIPAERLPAKSEDGIEMLREATLALGGQHSPAVSILQMTSLRGALRYARG